MGSFLNSCGAHMLSSLLTARAPVLRRVPKRCRAEALSLLPKHGSDELRPPHRRAESR